MNNTLIQWYERAVAQCKRLDFLALLAIRLYLIPVIYVGAHSKVVGFAGTVAWFDAPVSEGGLNLPFPTLLAFLARAPRCWAASASPLASLPASWPFPPSS